VTQNPDPAERQVRLEPSGRTFTVNPGETILEAAIRQGVGLP
jgi:CDP-4-dehydro-6-deoxyglucose reductase